ncbi:MAG: glycoside hydrolase family 3 N-terminal domain-containing protein [Verrucomicrobiota bacterium]
MDKSFRTGQCLIIGVPGPDLSGGFRDLVERLQPGGFILFARNLAHPEQVFSLVSELNALCDIPPIMTIDQEGGRVARLDRFGSASVAGESLGLAGQSDWTRHHGELTGELLTLFGFNLNLAPVVDFRTDDSRDNSLWGRCLGDDPASVIEQASAFLEGMESHQVRGSLKHFPGYTYCEKDPHGRIPVIPRSKDEIDDHELVPYKKLLNMNRSVMVGHSHFPAWHNESWPASLSSPIINGLLRSDLRFQGLVMTDDIEMGSIAQRFGAAEATRLAIEAGCDISLICHNPACYQLAAEALEQLPTDTVDDALKRIAAWKKGQPRPPGDFDSQRYQALSDEITELKFTVESQLEGAPEA